MKKWVLGIIATVIPLGGYSLPVGNPKEADLFLRGIYFPKTPCCPNVCSLFNNWFETLSFRAGYWGDFVFDRSLKVGHPFLPNQRKKIKRAQIFTNAGYFAFNFCNRVDVFTTLGMTQMRFTQDGRIFGALSSFESRLDFNSRFSWSLGARATLWEVGRVAMGIEGQYFSVDPNLSHFTNNQTGEVIPFSNREVHFRDWQVGLGLSYQVSTCSPLFNFVPYGAIKYSNAHLDLERIPFSTTVGGTLTSLILQNIEPRKHWGCAIGLSFTVFGRGGVTVEGDLGDEKALYINGQVRF